MYWKCLVLSFLLVSTATWSGVNGDDDPASTPLAKKDVQQHPKTDNDVDHAPAGQVMAQQGGHQEGSAAETIFNSDNKVFMVTVSAAGLAGFVGILMAGVCYYKFRRDSDATAEVEYSPGYGETGPQKEKVQTPGDRKLAQSAQMYHYQHQKQQMIAAMEKAKGDMKQDATDDDDDSEEDNTEGDYTVYECPGLAPTGEMEVKNPLFRGDDDMTPVNLDADVTTLQYRTNAGDLTHSEEH